MQSLQLQNDTLIDIATFLAKRWSGKENVIVGFSKTRQNETRLKEKKVLPQYEEVVEPKPKGNRVINANDFKNIVCGISASGPTKRWDIDNYIKLFKEILV